MVGRMQMGQCDHHLHQGFSTNANQILGGLSAIFFGDFAQLQPFGDTPCILQQQLEINIP